MSSLAPWIAAQTERLLQQSGHAWLLYGPSGLGQYSLGLSLVQAWLCDQPTSQGACGHCASCHAIEVRIHADLCLLMPETVMLDLGWPLSEKAQAEIDDKKRKPSKEIRVDALRDAIEFSQRTSARGKAKAVLIYPAERMNTVTANALLKTLEEPPGDVRFALATEAAHQLLPTIRSRCLGHRMPWPEPAAAHAWLLSQGIADADAQTALRAAGGRPQDALLLAQAGVTPWSTLAKAIERGDISFFKEWTPAQLVDALHKLCHDLLTLKAGSTPRFFAPQLLQPMGSWTSLSQWAKELSQTQRTLEHPFNSGLMLEALISQAQKALNSRT
ncbi:MAG: DNA polymerase III subunit delta' [Burkholderiaceae bacterium]